MNNRKIGRGEGCLLALAGAAMMFAGYSQAQATILTFDLQAAGNTSMPQAYGDNVNAASDATGSYGVGAEGYTPNVTVAYGAPGEGSTRWGTGYADLTNVYENETDGDTTLTLTLTADPGYQVVLYEFDMGAWSASLTFNGFTVTDLDHNIVLASEGSTFLSNSTHSHFDFGGGSGVSASNMQIVFDLSGLGGNSDNVGVDNIRIGQVVPEPASLALVTVGGLHVIRRRRRV